MAEPVVSFVLETIGKLLSEEAKFLSEVSVEAERLHSELEMMRAFLKDADGRQSEAAIVQKWVSQCRDLAYEAENVLEDYVFMLSSRRRKTGRLSMAKRFACILSECHIRHNVGPGIQTLSTRVSDLTRRFQEYGIRANLTEGEGSTSRQRQLMRMTYPYVANDEDFVGLEGDVAKLVKVLVNKHAVVSISGMGGAGKTTLARKVYSHRDVKNHFDSFAWVCVSQQWETRNLLQEILVSFSSPDNRKDTDKLTDNEIVEQLVHIMQEKKCLVVLDDIWSTDAWECIKVAFPLRKEGSHSKILITTRNVNVAEHIGPNGYHHQQRLLTEDESLKLLMKKATWPNPGWEDIQNLEVLGQEMVKFCGGLPLAVVVLGGILATKHSVSEWNLVYKNIRSYLGKGERIEQNQGEVERILALSYSDLPYKLKPCFLYLSVFSEDEEIKADRLYNLWIAEGMVFTEDGIDPDETVKEIADRYLGELAKRCIVKVAEKEQQPSHGRYQSCQLHDLMRDLCKAKAREENFLKDLEYDSTAGNDHRIMIPLNEENGAKFASIQMGECKALRTLLIPRIEYDNHRVQLRRSHISRFKMLRSLILESMWPPSSGSRRLLKLPLSKLIHLRYIRLSFSALFKMSPSSINDLEHLEVLDLESSFISWTKCIPIKTRRLRYLHLPKSCNNLMEWYVPNDLEVINGFPCIYVNIKNLSELVNVRELGPMTFESGHHHVKFQRDIIKCISRCHHLKDVSIECFRGVSIPLLEELFSSAVQSMYLSGKLGKLPEYDSRFLKSLVSLTLRDSKIEEDPMKMLEKLPNLQRLELHYDSFRRKELVCHSMGFPQLRFLGFFNLRYLETWTVEKGAMPNLWYFEITNCRTLSMIPLELNFISTLKQVAIGSMPQEFVKETIHKFRHVSCVFINEVPY